jgi:hypothetical protein
LPTDEQIDELNGILNLELETTSFEVELRAA